MSRPLLVPDLAVLLQDFFCQHLVVQRNVSPQTVASYRDAFRLLLRYAAERTRKSPVTLTLQDLDAPWSSPNFCVNAGQGIMGCWLFTPWRRRVRRVRSCRGRYGRARYWSFAARRR